MKLSQCLLVISVVVILMMATGVSTVTQAKRSLKSPAVASPMLSTTACSQFSSTGATTAADTSATVQTTSNSIMPAAKKTPVKKTPVNRKVQTRTKPKKNKSNKAIATVTTVSNDLCTLAGAPNDPATQMGTPNAMASLETTMLDNIAQNGFDNNPGINKGLGGLYINWEYNTSPLQTNFNGSGKTDQVSGTKLRHDPLTDIRYLHNLLLYKSQHPTDTRYDSQIAQFNKIIQNEFAGSKNQRGWLVDQELQDLSTLSSNQADKTAFNNIILSIVQSYSKAFNAQVGTIYQVNSTHPNGYYRPDWAIEQGAALIIEGTQLNNATWVQQGRSIINFVYNHAYIAADDIFPDQVDNVLLPGGQVNPNETFLTGTTKGQTVSGKQTRLGGVGQIALSFLHAYQATHDQTFLNDATNMLDAFSLPQNKLGAWDTTNLGYYFSVGFSGTGPKNPGQISITSTKKEVGRQATMLQAFHLADKLTNNRYQMMEQLMMTVVTSPDKGYYAPGHGVLYEADANWKPVVQNNVVQTWVTSEAMGAALEGLFTVTAG